MTPERLAEIVCARNKYGSANCWTGDTGTLSTMLDELLTERERIVAALERLENVAKITDGVFPAVTNAIRTVREILFGEDP